MVEILLSRPEPQSGHPSPRKASFSPSDAEKENETRVRLPQAAHFLSYWWGRRAAPSGHPGGMRQFKGGHTLPRRLTLARPGLTLGQIYEPTP